MENNIPTQPMMPQQQAQPQATPQGQNQVPPTAVPPQQGGQQKVLNGEDVQILLLQRVAQLNEEEQQIFDILVTPETIPVWMKIAPELGIVYEKATAIMEYDKNNPQQPNAGNAQQPSPQQQGQPQAQQIPQQQSKNPLLDGGSSEGLMKGMG